MLIYEIEKQYEYENKENLVDINMDTYLNPENVKEYIGVAGFGDYCKDLGMEGHDIHGQILIHHINPITKDDILHKSKYLLDPEFLICTIDSTHRAIHYGDENLLFTEPIERRRNDTCPWRLN